MVQGRLFETVYHDDAFLGVPNGPSSSRCRITRFAYSKPTGALSIAHHHLLRVGLCLHEQMRVTTKTPSDKKEAKRYFKKHTELS
jgi:hypothetical protein